MLFPIGSMTLGDILDRGLKLLMARLGTFYAINLIVGLPALIVQLVMPSVTASMENPGGPSGGLAVGALVGFLVLAFVSLIFAYLGNAASLRVVVQEFVGQPCGMGEALKFAWGRVGALIGTSILAGLAIMGGYFLLIVPGILFSIWFAFIAQVVVVEDLSGSAALGRSRDLTKGFRGRVLWVGFLLIIISLLVSAAAGLLQTVYPSYEVVRGRRIYPGRSPSTPISMSTS